MSAPAATAPACTRDESSELVRQCRWYIDHYHVESALADRLESVYSLQQLVNTERGALVAEQRLRAQTTRVERVAERAAMFGLQPWLDRMATVCPSAVATRERLLGAEGTEVLRVVGATSSMQHTHEMVCTVQH